MIRRFLLAALLVLLALGAGFFSLAAQLNPFWETGPLLPTLAAGSGFGFALAGWALSGPRTPRGFALVALGLNAGAAVLGAIVLYYG